MKRLWNNLVSRVSASLWLYLLVAFQDHHFFQEIIENEVIESDQCGKAEKR